VRERRKRDRERPCKQCNERGRERDREVRERERGLARRTAKE